MADLKKFTDLWHKMMYILTPSQKRWGVIVFLATFVGAFAELLGVSVILPYAQFMVAPETLRDYRIVDAVCTLLHVESNTSLVVLLTATVILVYLFKNVYLGFLSWFRVKYSTAIEHDLSVRMIRSYVNRGYPFFRRVNKSELLRGTGISIRAVYETVDTFFRILAEILTIAGIFTFIAITDISIALMMIVIGGLTLVLVMVVFRRKVQRAGRVYFEKQQITNEWLHKLFEGIKETIVMNRQRFFVDRYDVAFSAQQRADITRVTSNLFPTYYVEGICVTGLMLALCFKITHLDNPGLYVARLASYAVAVFRMLPSMGRIAGAFNSMLFQVPSVREVYDNFREADEYEARTGRSLFAEPGKAADTHAGIHTFSDELLVEDVTFRYPDGTENVLDGVTIFLKRGESIAFVGPSGAGKSTLADIILDLLKPEKGRILMDGLDLADDVETRSHNIQFVPQSVYLLDDTVRRNVAFGLYDEEINDERVWNALEQAQMREYIGSLPQGLDTELGERGVRFSGGQAQRIAIARALYTDPQILVLDEATSALDNETESAIMDAINTLRGEKTMIIIAHRLTTVKECDHIYEIRDGHAVEKRYEELK